MDIFEAKLGIKLLITLMVDEKLKQELVGQLTAALEACNKSPNNLEQVLKAFEFAYVKHIKQRRRSGELYIVHPVAVAITLIKLNADTATICAGLLHDVLEDTETTDEEIKNIFGTDIYQLVDGVTKLGKLNFKSSKEEQANNFRKMLIAIESGFG
jgi:GTP diphosphokinase / guanosine-3',5'-bis(diphosphate) 3'-diphosphatase